MSYADYCDAERSATIKHEYLRGEVFTLTDGRTPQHSALAARVTALLTRELAGRPCRVFNSDLRVRIEATDLATYPDVSVVCDRLETAPRDELAIVNPSLLVEVDIDTARKVAHLARIRVEEADLSALAGELSPLFAELMALHYDPHYGRSQSRHFDAWAQRQVIPADQ